MIRVDFTCENCRVKQTDIVVEPDSTVQCSDCEHVVDVGVYLGPAELAELQTERDPQMEVPEW